MGKDNTDGIVDHVIEVKNKDSRWVALDIMNSSIIAEGLTPDDVSTEAQKTGKQFMLMFVPKKGETYIF